MPLLHPGCAVVVFGGGAPNGAFGGAQVFVASNGVLSFNNGGDSLTLESPSGVLGATASFGAEGDLEQSLTRSPDVDGTINLHRQDLNGGPARRLTTGAWQQVGNFVTIDGKELVFEEMRPGTGSDLRILALDDSSEPRDLIATRFNFRSIIDRRNW